MPELKSQKCTQNSQRSWPSAVGMKYRISGGGTKALPGGIHSYFTKVCYQQHVSLQVLISTISRLTLPQWDDTVGEWPGTFGV